MQLDPKVQQEILAQLAKLEVRVALGPSETGEIQEIRAIPDELEVPEELDPLAPQDLEDLSDPMV